MAASAASVIIVTMDLIDSGERGGVANNARVAVAWLRYQARQQSPMAYR